MFEDADMATICNVDPSYGSRWEIGAIRMPVLGLPFKQHV